MLLQALAKLILFEVSTVLFDAIKVLEMVLPAIGMA